jgi:hypothetical protein
MLLVAGVLLTLSPVLAWADPGGNGNGNAYGLAKHAGEPLPPSGAELPGLALFGVGYWVIRKWLRRRHEIDTTATATDEHQ